MRGKNVIVSDELRNRMIKPRSPEARICKENRPRNTDRKVKPTSSMLMDKYVRQRQERTWARLHEDMRERSLCYGRVHEGRHDRCVMTPQRTTRVQVR
jgi:hypothetical protein